MDDRDFDANTVFLFAVFALVFMSSSLFSVPGWAFVALIAVPAAAMVVALARKRSYLFLAGTMLLISNGVAAQLDAPNWVLWILIPAAIAVIACRILLSRTNRATGDP